MTIQRQLKAIGTFSYQTAVVGRGEVYECYIAPIDRDSSAGNEDGGTARLPGPDEGPPLLKPEKD
jgi:hypothetical protein